MGVRKTLVFLAVALLLAPAVAMAADIQGKILRFDRSPVLGGRDEVATVQSQDGKEVMVNLGPRRELSNLSLGVGDQVTIHGKFVRSGEARVLMAEQVKKSDRSVTVDRTPRREFRGRVARLREVVVDNVPRLLADVEVSPGRETTVEVGPAANRNEYRIRVGDMVTIQASPGPAGERLMVLADRLLGQQPAGAEQNRRITGDVTSLTYGPSMSGRPDPGAPPGNADTSHLLVLLTDGRGGQTWVDFGRASDLGVFTIGLGDEVTAAGPMLSDQGRQVMIGQEIRNGRQMVYANPEGLAPQEAARPGTTTR